MAARFATVSKDEILAVNESAVPTNIKKETKFGLSVFIGRTLCATESLNFQARFNPAFVFNILPSLLQ